MVSSTKSMTGHMLGGAGTVEAIASVMALHTGIIPPTIGYEGPGRRLRPGLRAQRREEAKAERTLSVSLGFGGRHNACLAFTKA